MANPFGSADEALSKNVAHANQANLVFAMIPRTVNKWREVITETDVTPTASGNYDADGFWRSANTTFNVAAHVLGSTLSPGTPRTVITAVRYNGAGGGSGGIPHAGFWHDTNFTSNSRFMLRMDIYARQYQFHIFDGAGNNASGMVASQYSPGVDTSSVAARGNAATPAYDALYRVSGTNTAMGSSTSSTISSSDGSLNRFGCRTTNKWAVQYVFAYDTVLSDSEINAIIDDPASVITVGGGGGGGVTLAMVERGRAFGRGLGRGVF